MAFRFYTPFSQLKIPTVGGGNDLLEKTKRGISYVETRGAPDAYSKKGVVVTKGMYAGDRALGKYQVMGKNVGPWTKQYLGVEYTPEQFLANPDIQEKLADARMGELLKQYGTPEDVASVWFTGQPLAKAGGAPTDDTGTSNNEYQDIFKQGMAMAGNAVNSVQGAYKSLTQGAQNVGKSIGRGLRYYTPVAAQTIKEIPQETANLFAGAAQQTGKGLGMILDTVTPKEEDYPAITLPTGTELPRLDPTGVIGSTGRIGGAFAENAPKAFEGFTDLSTKLLEKLKGRTTVSKQFISDLTNSPDLKQAEKDTIRKALEDAGDEINVPDFANRVKSELLPLITTTPRNISKYRGDAGRYESINLPDELRGPVANYQERVYESPIKTSAGEIHFSAARGGTPENYFAHTRIEDLPDNKTRRVIEAQSDLFQKGRLENERGGVYDNTILSEANQRVEDLRQKISLAMQLKHDTTKLREALNEAKATVEKFKPREAEIDRLEPYRNTWHERIIREEVKQAAKDGKTKLQFPTGETAMKIEGLGDNTQWSFRDDMLYTQKLTGDKLKVGMEVQQGAGNELLQRHNLDDRGSWIITDVLGDGKFKAVSKGNYDNIVAGPYDEAGRKRIFDREAETFDISGKVDTENPIYRFYEKTVRKYLTNKYGAKEVTDPQGVKWMEIDIKPEMGRLPIEAFGIGAIPFIDRDNEHANSTPQVIR